MYTFTLGVRRGWLTRSFGRSPLVRTTDRVEALTLLLVTALVVVTAPIAGAVGTGVYSSHSAAYAEQANGRHAVTATVVQDSPLSVRPYSVTAAVHARWQDLGRNHEATFAWDRPAEAGAHLRIWVDGAGDYAGPPAPAGRAASDAICAGVVMWLAAVTIGAMAVGLVRFRLTRLRHAAWDRALRDLVGDDGGRTSSER